MNEFFGGVVGHIVVTLVGGGVGYFFRENLLWFGKLMDPTAKQQAQLIHGNWTAKETFSDDRSNAQYNLELRCRRAQVTGTQKFTSGRVDKNKTFDLTGSFENMVLNFTWTEANSIETGSVTLKYVSNKRLEGHGLYVINQKVYTSVFTADKI
jgi:hypothetical protein